MEAILKLFKKKEPLVLGTAGVCGHQNGVGVAQVIRPQGQPPRLVCCDFAYCDNDHGRQRALVELVERHGLGDIPFVLTMELGSYSLLQVESVEKFQKGQDEAIRQQIKDLIDFPVDEAIIDVFDVPTRGRELLAYVVATPFPEVKKRVELMHEAKLGLAAIDIPELAVRNLVELVPENKWGVGFLTFGPDQGTITVIRDSKIYFSRTINAGLTALYEFAAEKEVAGGQTLHPYQELLDDIALEIQRTFDFFERNSALPPIQTLLVAPTERPIFDLVPHLDTFLAADVRTLDLNDLLGGAENLSMETQARCLMAIGAALREDEAGS